MKAYLFGFLSDASFVFFFLFFEDDLGFKLLGVDLETLVTGAFVIRVGKRIFSGWFHLGQLRVKQLFELVITFLNVTKKNM